MTRNLWKKFFETLDRSQLKKRFHNFMLYLRKFQCHPPETVVPNQPYGSHFSHLNTNCTIDRVVLTNKMCPSMFCTFVPNDLVIGE